MGASERYRAEMAKKLVSAFKAYPAKEGSQYQYRSDIGGGFVFLMSFCPMQVELSYWLYGRVVDTAGERLSSATALLRKKRFGICPEGRYNHCLSYPSEEEYLMSGEWVMDALIKRHHKMFEILKNF